MLFTVGAILDSLFPFSEIIVIIRCIMAVGYVLLYLGYT